MNLNFTAMRTNQGHQIQNALAIHFKVISSFGYPDFRLKLTGHFYNLCCNSSMNTKLIGNNKFLFQNLKFPSENEFTRAMIFQLQTPPSLSI